MNAWSVIPSFNGSVHIICHDLYGLYQPVLLQPATCFKRIVARMRMSVSLWQQPKKKLIREATGAKSYPRSLGPRYQIAADTSSKQHYAKGSTASHRTAA